MRSFSPFSLFENHDSIRFTVDTLFFEWGASASGVVIPSSRLRNAEGEFLRVCRMLLAAYMAFWARVETRGYIPLVCRKCKVYSPVSNRKWKHIGRKAVRKLSGCNLFGYPQKLERSVFAFSALTEITYIQHNRKYIQTAMKILTANMEILQEAYVQPMSVHSAICQCWFSRNLQTHRK